MNSITIAAVIATRATAVVADLTVREQVVKSKKAPKTFMTTYNATKVDGQWVIFRTAVSDSGKVVFEKKWMNKEVKFTKAMIKSADFAAIVASFFA